MLLEALFIRHAESIANAGLPTSDPAAIPLSDRGREQAERLAAGLVDRPAFIGYSGFTRARETAPPLLARFPEVPSAVLPIHEFTYLSPASWRGTNTAQRKSAVDRYWEQADPTSCDGEGAESFAAFMDRVESLLDWLSQRPEGLVLLVSHEVFIKAVL